MCRCQISLFYVISGIVLNILNIHCVIIPERVICTRHNITATNVIPYMVRQMTVTSDGCFLGGSTALPPGPPRVNTRSLRNNFTIEIKSPYDASVKALEGFLVKIFVSGDPFNPDPEICFFINFTKKYTSANKLKEIMATPFSLRCSYKGTQPSNITVLTSSYPESIATTRVKHKIRVPGKFTPITDNLQLPSTKPQQQSSTATETKSTTGATRYIVAFILSVVVSVTVTASVVLVVKWRRTRTQRFHIHSDE